MRDVLQGGGFAGTTVPQAYESSTGSLQGIVERLMISKLLESTWRDSYNTFMIYIPNVIGDCAKWHTGTGDHDVRRYCGSTGMFLLRNLDPKSKEVGGPPGASNEDVASIGDFNIREFSRNGCSLQNAAKATAQNFKIFFLALPKCTLDMD